MTHTAQLSAYFKDTSNNLHHISTVIGTDPEGVTENDVNGVWREVLNSLGVSKTPFKAPVLITIQGGKA